MRWKSWELYHSTLHHPAQSYPVPGSLRHDAARHDAVRQTADPASSGNQQRIAPRQTTAPRQRSRFQRTASRQTTAPRQRTGRFFNRHSTSAMLLGGAPLVCLCCANIGDVFEFLLMHFEILMLLALLTVICISTMVPGTNLAIKVSGLIYNEQARGRYDLLALTPRGAAALHWALAVRCNQRDRVAVTLRRLVLNTGAWFSLPVAALLIPLLILAIIILVMDRSSASVTFLTVISLPLLLLGLYYVDYVQSAVIAFLLAVIIPAWLTSRSRVWMSWIAPLYFVTVQVLSYALFLIAFLYTSSLAWHSTSRENELTAFLLVLLVCGLMFGLREGIVIMLWRWAVRLFGDDLRLLRLD